MNPPAPAASALPVPLLLERLWRSRQSSRQPRDAGATAGAALFLGVLLVGVLSAAHAQTERHGIRVRYTSIASMGGLEGRAFLPVSTQGVSEQLNPDPSCKAQRLLTIHAALNRGPLRALKLSISAPRLGRVAMSTVACAAIVVEATLEDGSVLIGGQGYVHLHSLPSAADPTFRGAFAQTTSRGDVPVTIEGSFVVPAAKVSAVP